MKKMMLATMMLVLFPGCSAEDGEQPPEAMDQDMARVDDMGSPDDMQASGEEMGEETSDMPGGDVSGCQPDACPGGQIVNTPKFLVINPGEEFTYEPMLVDELGQEVEGVTFAYETSDPFIGSINATGILRGEGDGRIDITVSAAGLTATTDLSVSFVSRGITYEFGSVVGKVGESTRIYATTGSPFDFEHEVEVEAEYTSADESIATVGRYDGVIEFVSPGQTTITLRGRWIGIEFEPDVTVNE